MKADLKTIVILLGLAADIIVGSIVYDDLPIAELKTNLNNIVNSSVVGAKKLFSSNNKTIESSDTVNLEDTTEVEVVEPEVVVEEVKEEKNIVYDGMTLDELADKLNRSLGSTLSGTGYQFASRTTELGVDPYMAVGIVLLETGCAWDCSALVNQCYNVGGQKGAPGCWGGEYQAFGSLEEGINAFVDNLYYNYVAYGLTTPETINPKYAESPDWAAGVNSYIELIRSR